MPGETSTPCKSKNVLPKLICFDLTYMCKNTCKIVVNYWRSLFHLCFFFFSTAPGFLEVIVVSIDLSQGYRKIGHN